MKISVLTATYNRANLLEKLYRSLLENTKYKLETQWLIMDDGSTDETKAVVEKFKEEHKLEIQYFYQENQGKMQALNQLLPYATGELLIECDSDDYLKEDAWKRIEESYHKMDDNTYALCYLKENQSGDNMGKTFLKEETTMFDLYFKQGEDGEKALVFNTKIRKQYQYELEHNEKFITEARMYHKMDLHYKIKCINQPIMVCQYQEDGYTKNIQNTFKENKYGYYQYFKEMFRMNLKGTYFKKRLYIIKHYILFSTLTKKGFLGALKEVEGTGNKLLFVLLYVPGKIMTKIKFK